ncbi:MAG: outer membrane beta-barrel protein [Campylobacterota bacterium]|nr:outer membrane beta-barrel protein [Campylobacterota bacterium]
MVKKFTKLGLVCLVFSVSAVAGGNKSEIEPIVIAEPTSYVSLRFGPGWADDMYRQPAGGEQGSELHFKSEYGTDFAYGYYINDMIRVEGEFGCTYLGLDNETLSRTAETREIGGRERHVHGMLNIYADMSTDSSIRPFVGAGVGFDLVNLERSHTYQGVAMRTDDRDTAFAFQVMAGAIWTLTPSWEIELLGKYFNSGDRTYDNQYLTTLPYEEVDGTSITLGQLGVRYRF